MKIKTQGIPETVQGKKKMQTELSCNLPVSIIIIGILVGEIS
jgi:hypothetical protein